MKREIGQVNLGQDQNQGEQEQLEEKKPPAPPLHTKPPNPSRAAYSADAGLSRSG